MEYRGEVKQLEAKIDKGDYREKNGSPVYGKWLCMKIISLLQDFSVIREKLEAQRAFSSPRSISRDAWAPD